MSSWEEIVSAALIGVRTRPVDAVGLDPLVAQHLPTDPATTTAGTAPADPATRVLQIAALVATARQASGPGRLSAEPLPVAPPDPRPVLSDVAAGYAVRALELSPRTADWCLQLLADSGRRPPAQMLPDLLRRTARSVQIRPVVAAVVGQAGRRLAELAPELGAVLPAEIIEKADDPSIWTHGDPAERLSHLVAVRDRDPRAATELLAAGWASESGPDRELLITALASQASTHDEAFLERALDDRRGGVRAAAARILDTVPDSALQRRLFAAASAQLRLTRRRLRRHIEVVPTPPDPALRRDGIALPPASGGGRSVLGQLVARIPPSRWERYFDASPATIVDAVGQDPDALVAGLCDAARLHDDRRWADALLGHPLAAPEIAGLVTLERLTAAFAGLPEQQRAAAVESASTPWPESLSRQVFEQVARELRDAKHPSWQAQRYLDAMTTGLPATEQWVRAVDKLRAEAMSAAARLAVVAEALRIRIQLEEHVRSPAARAGRPSDDKEST